MPTNTGKCAKCGVEISEDFPTILSIDAGPHLYDFCYDCQEKMLDFFHQILPSWKSIDSKRKFVLTRSSEFRAGDLYYDKDLNVNNKPEIYKVVGSCQGDGISLNSRYWGIKLEIDGVIDEYAFMPSDLLPLIVE